MARALPDERLTREHQVARALAEARSGDRRFAGRGEPQVVTHETRAPWERPGGTTFHFVTRGVDEALRRARAVSGGKDIRISGGANLVAQCLNAGLVDELILSVAPTFLGGKRLFDEIEPRALGLAITEVLASPKVTHLRYASSAKRP